jgi:hypothetical protein
MKKIDFPYVLLYKLVAGQVDMDVQFHTVTKEVSKILVDINSVIIFDDTKKDFAGSELEYTQMPSVELNDPLAFEWAQ